MDALPARPFIIEHHRLSQTAHHFIPAARLVVTSSLRESGLLSLLSDKQARLLLSLLTFVSPNGQVQATAGEIARALGIPAPVAAVWLLHFSSRRFHGAHLIYRVKREEGYPFYALSRGAILHEHSLPVDEHQSTKDQPAGREAVVRHSRTTYGAPRAEVEPTIMKQLGHEPEELLDTPEGAVWRRLKGLHFEREDILGLIRLYGVDRIRKQLDWLPKRHAKNPARYLVASIRDNYAPPKPHYQAEENNPIEQLEGSSREFEPPGITEGENG